MPDHEHPRDIRLQAGSHGAMFEELACPDLDSGTSRVVGLDEFVGEYATLDKLGNGAAWARDDGPLGRKYVITRHKLRGKTVAIELMGYNRDAVNKSIPKNVRDHYDGQRCAVTDTGGRVEVDHKHGRYVSTVSVDVGDYQPISSAVNKIKREHCRKCRDTDFRFDARILGYSVGWTKGNEDYFSCNGCYWHDPREFNRVVSAGFDSGT